MEQPISIHDHASSLAPFLSPYHPPNPAFPPFDALPDCRDPQFASELASLLRPPTRGTLPTKTPAPRAAAVCPAHKPSQPVAQHSSRHAAPVPPAADGNALHRKVYKAMDAHLSPAPPGEAPPPPPPNFPSHDRVKSVSILMPTDISPTNPGFPPSQSDLGHSYRTAVNGTTTSPEGAPGARAASFTSPHVSPSVQGDDILPSSKVLCTRASMELTMRKASSTHPRRNKLHKPRQHSLPSLPSNHSLFSSLFSRAFGSHDGDSPRNGSSSTLNMSDGSYRPTRSVSDSGHRSIKRPSPSSRSSDATDSSCTTSSSGSTAVSYASTALTTPDSTSPSLSPRNSTKGTRTNKLHKRRPPLAPSAVYQYPLGASASVLGRSKSTPNDIGQRAQMSRNWSSVKEAQHDAEEADALDYGPNPTSWFTSSTDLSPSRRATLDPIFEVRSKRSLHALAQLASTGLCSTTFAAISSQLALEEDFSERFPALDVREWDVSSVEQFNPYVECALPMERVTGASGGPAVYSNSPPSAESSSSASPSPPQRNPRSNGEASSSGFAVVSGSLDRSEDAMRRWTLAMADVPDEVLVHHLERLRKESVALARGRLPGRRSAAPSQIGHGEEDSTLDTRDRRSSFFFGGPREMGISPRSSSHARFSVGNFDRELDGDNSDDEALSDGDDEEDWKTARQVLFCCRELVQTERNYQARIRELAATELSSHYATLVSRHIPALLRVSETLLTHLVDDPSAWGVSTAFIGCEEELEAALVAWSGAVGAFFSEDANLKPARKLTKKLADDGLSNHGHDSPAPSMRLSMRTRSQNGLASPKRESIVGRRFSSTMSDVSHGEASSSVGHAENGMFTAALGTGLAFGLALAPIPPPYEPDYASTKPGQAKSAHGHGHGHGAKANASMASGLGLTRAVTAVNAWKRKSMPSSLSNLSSLTSPPTSPHPPSPSHGYGNHNHAHAHQYQHMSTNGSAHGHGKKYSEHDAKMYVREMAIQPTQRVMRYVLQYRDLLDHTPTTSPSRALVERAYEIALRIAKKCDRAQAHAAFLCQQPQK
ncbi:hypothetical protein BC628DRAFT_1183310 [Trametes gibbosa]|nr:hypothetical protein BC628DRAFT_1183310 [Trametes gibbosa]